MSNPRQPNPTRPPKPRPSGVVRHNPNPPTPNSGARRHVTPGMPNPNPTTPNIRPRGRMAPRIPVIRNPNPATPNIRPGGHIAPGIPVTPSPIPNPPSPSTANADSDPPIVPLDEVTDEKLNDSKDDLHEIEQLKIISSEEKTETDRCAICMDDFTEPKKLDKCGHTYCTDCIEQYFKLVKPQCPCCFTIYGEIRGNQPDDGRMTEIRLPTRLPGFEKNSKGTIQITYHFPSGTQDERHPNPGMPYSGTTRDAYLPDNQEGRRVHELLKKAFELRQVFTVGQSRTTGCDNTVTWNDVHHKTSINGGMSNFGYPDKTYLNRVQQELAAKGVQ